MLHSDLRVTARRFVTLWMILFALISVLPVIVAMESTVSAAEDRFPISKIEFQGNFLFSEEVLQNATGGFLGDNKTVKDLEMIQNAVFSVYNKAGYKLVSVVIIDRPDSAGLLTVIVKEDILRNVKITGNKYLHDSHIRQALPALKTGYPTNVNELDKQLLVANEYPSRVLAISLKPIEVGVFEAIVTVTEGKMITHTISLDNTGNRNQDPLRGRYRFAHTGLGGRRDATGIFIYSRSPSNNIQQYLAYYNQPLSPKGDSIYLMGAYSNSKTGLTQTGYGNFNVAGQGHFYSLHYVYPIYRTLSTKLALDFGIEYRNSIDNTVTEEGNIKLFQDINSLPLSISTQYNWQGKTDNVSFNITYVRNIPGGYLNDDETYYVVRRSSSSQYQLWRGTINYLHRFKNGWIFNNRYDWQYTTQPLIPDEQFGLGGVRSIRGFEEREALGDKGVSTSFELYTPPLGHGVRLLAFYDIGQFWSFDTNFYGDLVGPTTLSSAGIGLRWTINKTFSLNVDYAYVIKGYITPEHDARIHFDLSATF